MKNLKLLIIIFFITACSKNGEKTGSSGEFSFKIEQDTVTIDSKGKLIMTAVNMVNFDLNPEKDRLFCFDRKSHSLEIIDLQKLVLLDQVEFAKDGPDALSGFQQKLIALENNKIFIMGLEKSGIYTTEGKLIKEIPLSPKDYQIPDHIGNFGFKNDLVFLNDSTILTGLLSVQEIQPYLVKLQLGLRELNLINFDPIKDFEKFKIELENPKINYFGKIYHVKVGDKVLISSNFVNEIYLLDPETEELTHFEFKSTLTPDTKSPTYKSLVSTPEDFRNEMRIVEEQIEFGKWYWDDHNQTFLRLSYYRIPNQEDGKKANVYLTVFDQEFKMLGEMQVPGYNKVPGNLFVKDGMIWFHENIDDELGFVRLKIIIG